MVGCFGQERVRPLSCMKEASFEFLNERLEYHAHGPFTLRLSDNHSIFLTNVCVAQQGSSRYDLVVRLTLPVLDSQVESQIFF